MLGQRTKHDSRGSRLAKFRPPPPLPSIQKREIPKPEGEDLERYPEITRPMDARFASWLATSPAPAVGYHLSCGLSLPEREAMPHGIGPGWQGRALAAVLRECYRRGTENPTLEEIEVAALSVLPAPEQYGDGPRPPAMRSTRARWERAIVMTAKAVRAVLRHGPASGAAGGEVLFTGGILGAEASGLELEQRVDMIWRRPDRTLEAVLVFEESVGRGCPRPAEDDWRCVLAAAVVRSLHGETPDVHAVWISSAAARVSRIPDETLDERLGLLSRALDGARDFGGLSGDGEGAFYRLADVAGSPYEPAGWSGAQRPRGSGGSRRDREG